MAAASGVAWGRAGLFISRGLAPLPPPRPSKGAPPFPPSGLPLRGSPPSGNYSGGRGARSRAPRLRRGRLRAGRAPLHPRCLCGLPPGLWPCALRLPRRVRRPRPAARVAPVVWWPDNGDEGGAILQRERMGDGHAPPALRSPPDGGDLAVAMQKSPRSDQKRGFIRRASGRRGMGHSIRRWRRSAYSAANSRRTRLQARPRTPCGTCRICHPADTGRPRSLSRSGKSSESGARRLPFCASPLSAISSLLVAIPSRARPLPCCPHRPTPVYTGRGWGSKHFLSFFALKNRWPQSSARRRSSAQQRALFPALGAR